MTPTTLLLIDDNPADQALVRESLRDQKKVRLRVLDHGDAVLRYLHREPPFQNEPRPSLVLLDLNLPDRPGLEILEAIRGDPELSPIPVIIFSASTRENDLQRSYALGANAFVSKPTSFDEFENCFTSIMSFWLGIAVLPDQTWT